MLPATDAMLTIAPEPRASMPGRQARISRYMDRTFRLNEKSQASSSQSRMVPACTKPAPLNSTSTGPAASASARTARPSVTSSTWVRQPDSVCSAAPFRSTASTSAPSLA
ncbi:hypothetical protein D3C85_1396850 [compost metagenome]